MKVKPLTLLSVVLAICLVAALLFTGGTITGGSGDETGYTTKARDYDPWLDYNDDGKIRIDDVLAVALAFGTDGTALTKAAVTYDSGWVDITDKAGQYFNITHNLNSTDVIVDITGKTTLDGGVHQRHLGLTGYTGWSRTYGGTNSDGLYCIVQTSDGGYAIAGYTKSFGAGDLDFWLVKTDSAGNMQWNKTTEEQTRIVRSLLFRRATEDTH